MIGLNSERIHIKHLRQHRTMYKKERIVLKHCGTQTIETKRLILRRFEVADAEAMYQNWASDPAVSKFLSWQPHKNEEETRALLTGWTAAYEKPDCYNWVIVPKSESAEPIGSISVSRIEENIRCAAIGYCIGQAWWRRGITSEALDAVIDFLFKKRMYSGSKPITTAIIPTRAGS